MGALGCLSSLLLGCASPTQCSGEARCSLRLGSQPMFLLVRNSRGWDGGHGSETPVHPDSSRNYEELRTVFHIHLCTQTLLETARS